MSFQFYKKHEKEKISSLLIKHDFEENLKHLKSQLEKTDLMQIDSLKNNAPKINIRTMYKEITKKNISITGVANDKPKDILPKIIKDYSLPIVFSEQELECIENIIKDESL
jgi:ABC-type sulfate/molybdate transport systems ATPase subunit